MNAGAQARRVVRGLRWLLLAALLPLLLAGCARVAAKIDSITPREVVEAEVGDTVTLSMTFTNTGNRDRAFIARATVLDAEGAVVRAHETVLDPALEAGKQTTVNWDHVVRREGTYEVQFSLWRDADTALGYMPEDAQKLIAVREAEPEDPPPPTAEFGRGDRIQVTGALRVRVAPGTDEREVASPYYPGSMPVGSLGTIVDGPQEVDGYVWWKIDYDRGVTGWSAQDWLERRTGGG